MAVVRAESVDLFITDGAVTAIREHVKYYGGIAGVETGGFLLCSRGSEANVSLLALTGRAGVLREPDRFQITGEALEELAEWADFNDMLIAAQFHSHGGPAFLSPIDASAGFRIEGLVSAVVPDFADPPNSLNSWGWWCFRHGDWLEVCAPTVVEGGTEILTFDANGVVMRNE
jgi:hypothetical protein